MFNYCGDIVASLDDYCELLKTVIRETFPTVNCTVRIRQTKAMPNPKVSISIIDGPMCSDFVAKIPLLSEVNAGAAWAYRGKVLPSLGWWVRSGPKSSRAAHSKAVWNQMQQENPELQSYPSEWSAPPRERTYSVATHKRRLSTLLAQLHPSASSPTMAAITRGNRYDINRIAIEQRRDELERATPLARSAAIAPAQRVRRL